MRSIYRIPVVTGWSIAMLVAVSWFAGCDSAVEPPASAGDGETGGPVAAIVTPTTPTEFTVIVGMQADPTPSVRVTDPDGNPLEGVPVSFNSNGGEIADRTAVTDADGSASVGSWTLGTVAGVYQLTAGIPARDRLSFTATAVAGPVARVESVAGSDQVAEPNTTLGSPLTARVADAYNNPIEGALVEFEVLSGGGAIANGSAVTDAEGLARSGTWTLGPDVGIQTVRAVSGDIEVVFPSIASGVPTDLPGRLSFVSDRDGNRDIYSMNADGSGLTRLTANGGTDESPAWSPDGSRIAFTSDGGADVYVMSADGSGRRRQASGWSPAWSPDGAGLAYAALKDGDVRIASVSDGLPGIVYLTDHPGYNDQPSWSPDGGRLAFKSDRAAYDFLSDIYVLDVATGEVVQLTRGWDRLPEVHLYFHPSWSPDGSTLALVHGTMVTGSTADLVHANFRFEVALMAADGGPVRTIAWAGDISWYDLTSPGSLAWSPDGKGIAYTFVDCDLEHGSGCSGATSVKYVSADGVMRGTLVENADSPSWTW